MMEALNKESQGTLVKKVYTIEIIIIIRNIWPLIRLTLITIENNGWFYCAF